MSPALMAFVAIGGGLVVLLCHMLGGSQRVKILSVEDVTSAFFRDYPERRPLEICLADDAHAALLWDVDDDVVGLVFAVGAHLVTRELSDDLWGTVSASPSGLSIRFDDLGNPVVHVRLGDRDTRERWLGRLPHGVRGQGA